MKRSLSLSVAGLLLILNLSVCGSALGGGYDNPVVGIKAIGMGYAFAGIADDASAVYYNPAGLSFQEPDCWHSEVYVYTAFTDVHYKANGVNDQSDDIFIIPGFFASKTFEKWAFGFGGYIPYAGGGITYDGFQGNPYKLEGAAGWNAVTGAVAYRLSPTLSIGCGISIYIGEMTSKFFDPGAGGMVENKYNGYSGYGGHVGLFYKPAEEIGIGLILKSEVPIEMDGTVSTPAADLDSEVEFTLPCYLTFGLGYKPFPRLTLGFSTTYQFWEDLDKLTFTTANIETDQLTRYMNSWVWALGVDYKVSRLFTIRAGINYRQGSTQIYGLVPVSNDVDMIGPRIGFAYNVNDSTELNLSVLQNFGLQETFNSQKFDQDGIFVLFGCRMKY